MLGSCRRTGDGQKATTHLVLGEARQGAARLYVDRAKKQACRWNVIPGRRRGRVIDRERLDELHRQSFRRARNHRVYACR